MKTQANQRRLTAILAADVVGYSRLMHHDEVGTLAQLKAHQREIVEPALDRHGGRVFKSVGDGYLAEFPSVVEAVACAVEIQRSMAQREAGVPEDRRIEFRIGINAGDVLIDGDDIFGDGVNVAARLESLAPPGGILISGAVYEQLRHKLALTYDFIGRQALKNIDQAVPVFRVNLTGEQQIARSEGGRAEGGKARRPQLLVALAGTVVALALAVSGWIYFGPYSPQAVPAADTVGSTAQKTINKPSIAVLPLDNLSGDPNQEYFSDGISESLITELARFSELLVIARNSSFAYKDSAVDIRQVGKELGARYVLEGSVQTSADRIRITGQLIDASTGHHVWAERYDRVLDDLFAVQDEITRQIVGALAVKVGRAERERALAKPPGQLDAYDLVLHGRERLSRATASANREARLMFEQAIALAPRYASAHLGLGQADLDAALYGWTEWVEDSFDSAHQLAQKAISLEDGLAEAYRLQGRVHLHRGQYERAASALARAIELNPNDAEGHAAYGAVELWSGRPEAAIQLIEMAMRLDPKIDVENLAPLGLAYYLKERYGDAAAVLETGLARRPGFLPAQVVLAAAYGQLGDREAAMTASAEVFRVDPFFEVEAFTALLADVGDQEHVAEGLRMALEGREETTPTASTGSGRSTRK